jgi:hypothetical protein
MNLSIENFIFLKIGELNRILFGTRGGWRVAGGRLLRKFASLKLLAFQS